MDLGLASSTRTGEVQKSTRDPPLGPKCVDGNWRIEILWMHWSNLGWTNWDVFSSKKKIWGVAFTRWLVVGRRCSSVAFFLGVHIFCVPGVHIMGISIAFLRLKWSQVEDDSVKFSRGGQQMSGEGRLIRLRNSQMRSGFFFQLYSPPHTKFDE